VKEGEMGGACMTHGRDENLIKHFVRKTWREKTIQKTES